RRERRARRPHTDSGGPPHRERRGEVMTRKTTFRLVVMPPDRQGRGEPLVSLTSAQPLPPIAPGEEILPLSVEQGEGGDPHPDQPPLQEGVGGEGSRGLSEALDDRGPVPGGGANAVVRDRHAVLPQGGPVRVLPGAAGVQRGGAAKAALRADHGE